MGKTEVKAAQQEPQSEWEPELPAPERTPPSCSCFSSCCRPAGSGPHSAPYLLCPTARQFSPPEVVVSVDQQSFLISEMLDIGIQEIDTIKQSRTPRLQEFIV